MNTSKIRLHGTLQDNLEAALASSRRLRGAFVYPDTLAFWAGLVAIARDESAGAPTRLDALTTQLEEELALRVAPAT